MCLLGPGAGTCGLRLKVWVGKGRRGHLRHGAGTACSGNHPPTRAAGRHPADGTGSVGRGQVAEASVGQAEESSRKWAAMKLATPRCAGPRTRVQMEAHRSR